MSAATITPDVLLVPVFEDLLTPESAGRMVAHALPPHVLSRLEVLRDKAGEGQLDPAERQEYAGLIDAMGLIALAKVQAPRLLASANATGA